MPVIPGAGATGQPSREALNEVTRKLITDDFGTVVMCSSRGGESSLEDDKVKHGYFNLCPVAGPVRRGLDPEDGLVYLHKLDAYVTDEVMKLSKKKQNPVTSKPLSLGPFPLAKPMP